MTAVASPTDLSFAFLEEHPAAAARVLERVAPLNVAALIAEAPTRAAAPALRVMSPLHASRCLEPLDDDVLAGLLRAMGAQAGVAVLHYFPEARRNALLARQPTVLALTLRLLLGYPEDTVGAWMDPHVVALPADTTAEAALQRLRESDTEHDSCIFVLGSDERLLGQARFAALFRARPDTPLLKLMDTSHYALPARAPIRAVRAHTGWELFTLLPVVEREGRFVGALHRATLSRVLSRGWAARSTSAGYGALAGDVADGYWAAVSGLIELVVALIPAPRNHNGEAGHER